MPDNWYYTTDGKTKIGPVTFAALQELAASATLHPDHMIRQEGQARWSQAKTNEGLFPAAPVESSPPATQKPKGMFGSLSSLANK